MLIENATQFYVSAIEYVKSMLDRDEEGQGMIEYGLLVALISIAALAVIVLIGPKLTTYLRQRLQRSVKRRHQRRTGRKLRSSCCGAKPLASFAPPVDTCLKGTPNTESSVATDHRPRLE